MRDLTVLRLSGNQEQMGAAHAEIVGGDDMMRLFEYYQHMPSSLLLPPSRQRKRDHLLIQALQPFLKLALRRLDAHRVPAFRDRTSAYCRAADIDPGLGRYFAVMDLFQNAVGLAGRIGMIPMACSSMVAWGDASDDGRLLHARNFDFPGVGVWDMQPTLVFNRPDKGLRYAFVTTRGADVPGVTGFNEAGIAFDAHTRFHKHVTFNGTTVVDVGHDVLCNARTLDDAIRILRGHQHASTYGFTVSSAHERRAVIVEVTARDVQVVQPKAGESFLVNTNRYQSPDLQSLEVTPHAAATWNSDSRHQCARRSIREAMASGGVSVEALQAALADHRDVTGTPRAGGPIVSSGMTVKSVVMDVERGEIHLGMGEAPTAHGPWITVPMDWSGPDQQLLQPQGPQYGPERFRSGPTGEAFRHYMGATTTCYAAGSTDRIVSNIDKAVALDPTEPTYRFLAGALALGGGDAQTALTHFDAGLAYEREPFQVAQLQKWHRRAQQQPRRWKHLPVQMQLAMAG